MKIKKDYVVMLVCAFLLIPILAIRAYGVTINYADWAILVPDRADRYKEIAKLFEQEHPNVKVNLVGIPYSAYIEKLTNMFEAGKGPEIVKMPLYVFCAFQKFGYLDNLDKYIDFAKYSKNLAPQQKYVVRDGKNYGVVCELVPYELIYNKKLLKEAGLTVPLTPDELLRASEIVAAHTEALFGLIAGTNFGNPAYILQEDLPMIYGFGGKIVKNGKFTVNSPEFIEGVEYIKRVYESPGTPADMPFGQQRKAQVAGKAAFTIDGSYWFSLVAKENPETLKQLDATLLPFPCRWTTTEVNVEGMSANIRSKEVREAAVEFLEYFLSRALYEKLFPVMLTPVIPFQVSSEKLRRYPWYWPYDISIPYAIPNIVPGYELDSAEIRTMIVDYIARACMGKMSVREAMNECQKELERRFYK